ncbi:molybdopterin-binding protein [Mollicutes bacterium LVI A0039]|nr:molybdopterin-binding protein [Mollicutes bacterium LVI A0039]
MKKVGFKEALGQALAHDICEIKGQTVKQVAFKRGHIIKPEDEDYLLELGKQHFFVLEPGDEDLVHEEDAARIMFETINNGDFSCSPVSMGKISFIANTAGFFTVDSKLLTDFNMLGQISAASIAPMQYVKQGQEVASMRIIPLFTTKQHIEQIKAFANAQEMFKIIKIENTKIAQITTGSEVATGKIADGFKPKLNEILSRFDLQVSNYSVVTDDKNLIQAQITAAKAAGAELILVTGGMSVDPDDLTPGAIKAAGAKIITYGTPIIPGSMFLYGLLDNTPILGLPGAVIFEQRTAFDLLLPYALTNTKITTREIMEMSVGGMLNG